MTQGFDVFVDSRWVGTVNASTARIALKKARKKVGPGGRLTVRVTGGDYSRPIRKNPTKAQKRAKAATARKRSGIAKAVKGLLKKMNPSAAISGASVVRLKGGALRITPLKSARGKR